MKLFVFAQAPNPMKVLVYLREKGIEIPLEDVDLAAGETRTPEFLRKNPLGTLPILELDDGSYLTESAAIIGYLEDLHPSPPMMGASPLERARIREAERIADLGVLLTVGRIFQNTSPLFSGRVKQSADVAAAAREQLGETLTVLDARIGDQPFVCGAAPTVADCTLYAGLALARFAQIDLDPTFTNIARWFADFAVRPSTSRPA